MGWVADWLVGRLVADWLAVGLVGWLVCWLADKIRPFDILKLMFLVNASLREITLMHLHNN